MILIRQASQHRWQRLALTSVISTVGAMAVTYLVHTRIAGEVPASDILPIATLYFNRFLGLPPCEDKDFTISSQKYESFPAYRRFCDVVAERVRPVLKEGHNYCVWTAAPPVEPRGFPFVSRTVCFRIWIDEFTTTPSQTAGATFFDLAMDAGAPMRVLGLLGNFTFYFLVAMVVSQGMVHLIRRLVLRRSRRRAGFPVTKP